MQVYLFCDEPSGTKSTRTETTETETETDIDFRDRSQRSAVTTNT